MSKTKTNYLIYDLKATKLEYDVFNILKSNFDQEIGFQIPEIYYKVKNSNTRVKNKFPDLNIPDFTYSHHAYTPDFCIEDLVIEVKGSFNMRHGQKMRQKYKHILDYNKKLRNKFIMVLDQPTQKIIGTKMTHIDFCEKHSIHWCSKAGLVDKINELLNKK